MLEWKEITICFHGQTYLAKGELKGDAGEIVGILGESGCGKSALLNVFSGVDRENHCLLWEEGRPLKSDEKSRRCFRRERLAYVTQNACLPGGVRLGEWLDRVGGRKELQKELEERLGLSSYREKRIRTLSGGERQRAALAAALLKERDVLLADEVTASQDEGSAAVMRTLLREAAQRGSLIILVTHDAKTAALCDRLYEYQGQQLREVRFPEAAKPVKKDRGGEDSSSRKLFVHRVPFVVVSLLLALAALIPCAWTDFESSWSNGQGYVLDAISPQQLTICHAYGTGEGCWYDGESMDEPTMAAIRSIDGLRVEWEPVFGSREMTAEGHWGDNTLRAWREGAEIVPRAYGKELQEAGYELEFSVQPYHDWEGAQYDADAEGVYVNRSMAYMYQLQEGDLLQLTINVPFASARMLQEQIKEDGTPYHSFMQICEPVTIETRVLGIVDVSDSWIVHDNQLLMSQERMQALIDMQQARYAAGEISVNTAAMEGYSEVVELQGGMYAGYVEDIERVPAMIEQLEQISDDVTVVYDYGHAADINAGLQQERASLLYLLLLVSVIVWLILVVLEHIVLHPLREQLLVWRLEGASLWELIVGLLRLSAKQGILFATGMILVALVGVWMEGNLDFLTISPGLFSFYQLFHLSSLRLWMALALWGSAVAAAMALFLWRIWRASLAWWMRDGHDLV